MGWSQWRSPSLGTDFAPGTAEPDIQFARDLGLMASFHVACAKHGPRPQSMQSLAQQGLLGKDINLVHANFLSADEFRLVANHGATVSVTPEVEMQMGLGLPPTGAVLAAGAELNIGTDVVTGVSTDMFTQMRFLIQTQRALANDEFHRREVMPDKLAVTVDDVAKPWQFSFVQRSKPQIGENMLPKTARAGGAGRAPPWLISAGQQIYGRRDVGVSYESDFDAGQRLPTNCQIELSGW